MLRNVASQRWRVYAWDRSNGAPKTGDAANISAYITKDDGTPAATNDAAPTEVSSTNEPGYYEFDLTQAETAAAKLSLSPKSSTSNINVIACPPVIYTRPQYFSQQVIDSNGVASANVTQFGGSAGTFSGGRPEVNLTAAGLAADAVAEIQSGLAQNADVQTLLTNLAVVDSTADAILLDTAEIGVAGAGLTAIPWNAAWDAEVQSEVDDALIAKGLDHLVFASVAGTDVADNSIIARLVSKSATADWDSFDNTTDSHEALRDRGDAAWTTATGFSTLDAAGVRTAIGLASANLDTQLAALDTAVDAIDADVTTLLANLATVDGNVDAILLDTGTDGVVLTSGAVDSLWDDAITEPAGIFAWASATPRKILQTLGVLMRNEATSDSNSVDIKSDAGLTLWSYPSSDDGSIFTSGEAA